MIFVKDAPLSVPANVHNRPQLKIVCCADRGVSSMGTFDAALRFARAGDRLTVLHVQSGAPEEETRTEAGDVYYYNLVTGEPGGVVEGKGVSGWVGMTTSAASGRQARQTGLNEPLNREAKA